MFILSFDVRIHVGGCYKGLEVFEASMGIDVMLRENKPSVGFTVKIMGPQSNFHINQPNMPRKVLKELQIPH